MEGKIQDVKSLEELLKVADEFRKWVVDFGNELSKVLADIQASKKEEDTWEMKCPYEIEDDVYVLTSDGEVIKNYWVCGDYDRNRFKQGSIFLTEQEANLESKRRNLLTRFRAFRDECNGDWKPDWDINNEKYLLYFSADFEKFYVGANRYCYMFNQFGYFKDKTDAGKALELFGDEIKELFVEAE